MDAAQAEHPPATAPETGIAGYFKFAERGTNLLTETRAGLTTFLVMAYIIFLNPAILSAAGIDVTAAAAATLRSARPAPERSRPRRASSAGAASIPTVPGSSTRASRPSAPPTGPPKPPRP